MFGFEFSINCRNYWLRQIRAFAAYRKQTQVSVSSFFPSKNVKSVNLTDGKQLEESAHFPEQMPSSSSTPAEVVFTLTEAMAFIRKQKFNENFEGVDVSNSIFEHSEEEFPPMTGTNEARTNASTSGVKKSQPTGQKQTKSMKYARKLTTNEQSAAERILARPKSGKRRSFVIKIWFEFWIPNQIIPIKVKIRFITGYLAHDVQVFCIALFDLICQISGQMTDLI